jgi:hypothetical protein
MGAYGSKKFDATEGLVDRALFLALVSADAMLELHRQTWRYQAQATEPPAKLVTKPSTASKTPQPSPTSLGGSAAFCKSAPIWEGQLFPKGTKRTGAWTQRSGLHPHLSLRPLIWAQSSPVLAVEV